MEKGVTALYLRLSREDEANRESQSIGSQRQILRDYARAQGLENLREYVDDGWSGTVADRPAFQELLRDVEAGAIAVVLVKDLSRLGRNVALTTYLLDEYFPARRIRCCAVGDGCDTALQDRFSHKLGAITNLMNEWYSEDLSCKIRDALAGKRRAGEYVGSHPPYGYRRDPENRHHLVPDPAAAETVKMIFRLAQQGHTFRYIAALLNEAGIASPLDYRQRKNGKIPWRPGTLSKLIRNPVYRGALAQGKSRKLSYKSRKMLPVPACQWTVCEGCHEPLVSRKQWQAAQHGAGGKREKKAES